MSIFFILSIAGITCPSLAGSVLCMRRGNAVGMICHDNPNLSLSQPHGSSEPSADNLL